MEFHLVGSEKSGQYIMWRYGQFTGGGRRLFTNSKSNLEYSCIVIYINRAVRAAKPFKWTILQVGHFECLLSILIPTCSFYIFLFIYLFILN